ncbi:MAG: hypothetical protein L0221_19470 [Chloroflexi bacterium]|nr:hypothetical protein [Chloroflexota bacterium]
MQTRLRAWSGGKLGAGTATNTDTAITPPPKVREPPARLVFANPGKYESGDVEVLGISREYDEDDLTGGTLAAGEEFVWLVDDRPYRVVDAPEKRNFEWRVQLRRLTGR